jgi:hypothetical protein
MKNCVLLISTLLLINETDFYFKHKMFTFLNSGVRGFFYLCTLLENYMIQSMTGFGKATIQLPTKKITVEIKSLNSKGLDLNVRMPSLYREMELGLRTQIASALERGKVDFLFLSKAPLNKPPLR